MNSSDPRSRLTVEELVARITAGVTATILKEVYTRLDAAEARMSEVEKSILSEVKSELSRLKDVAVPADVATRSWVAGYVKESVAARIPDEWVTREWVVDYVKSANTASGGLSQKDSATQTWVSGYVAEQMAVRLAAEYPTLDWVKQYVQDQIRHNVVQTVSIPPIDAWTTDHSDIDALERRRLMTARIVDTVE